MAAAADEPSDASEALVPAFPASPLLTPAALESAARAKWLAPDEDAFCGMDMGSRHLNWNIIAYKRLGPRIPRSRKKDAPPPPVRPEHWRVVSWRAIDLEADAVYGSYDAPRVGPPDSWAMPWQHLPGTKTLPNGFKPQLKVDIYRHASTHLRPWAAFADTLCPTHIEVQMRNNQSMVELSKAHFSMIEMHDQHCGRAPYARTMDFTAKKAGVERGAGCSDDKAHKAASIAHMHAAVAAQHDVGAQQWLARMACVGWKLDDPADAMNMALHRARLHNDWEAPEPVAVAAPPSALEDVLAEIMPPPPKPPRAPRKRARPEGAPPAKPRKRARVEGEEGKAPPRKRARPNPAKKTITFPADSPV